VRALYDFQPTEQGELGFEKGDIIRVIESVYRDWWKGELRGRTGIFPVNYVEKIVDPSPSDIQKEASIENEVLNQTNSIDRLLELLINPDPRLRDSFSDNDELQSLYNNALSIRPKLVKLIEKYSLKKGNREKGTYVTGTNYVL
jgi:signal transducing adaptor molecule